MGETMAALSLLPRTVTVISFTEPQGSTCPAVGSGVEGGDKDLPHRLEKGPGGTAEQLVKWVHPWEPGSQGFIF